MIKVNENEVEIEVPKGEENKGTLLIAELGTALIEVSKELEKDVGEVLKILNKTILFAISMKEVVEELKDCIGEEDE